MGIRSNSCGLDEFYDSISGLCGHCMDVCHDSPVVDDLCLHFCPGYQNKHQSSTFSSSETNGSQELLLFNTILVSLVVTVALIFISCLIIIICHLQKRKQKTYILSKRLKSQQKLYVNNLHMVHMKYKFKHQRSVQETKDPSEQEEHKLSVLCISSCSSIMPSASSRVKADFATAPSSSKSLKTPPAQHKYISRSSQTHEITTHAIVSSKNLPLLHDETLPKTLCVSESCSEHSDRTCEHKPENHKKNTGLYHPFLNITEQDHKEETLSAPVQEECYSQLSADLTFPKLSYDHIL